MGKVIRIGKGLYRFTSHEDCVAFYWHLLQYIKQKNHTSLGDVSAVASDMFKKDYVSEYHESEPWTVLGVDVKPDMISYKKWSSSYSTLTIKMDDKPVTVRDFITGLDTLVQEYYDKFIKENPHLVDTLKNVKIEIEAVNGVTCMPVVYKEVE